jgi:FO synthase subunit 2
MKPSQFRALIREMGRIPAQRSTTYEDIKVFDQDEAAPDLLDQVGDPSERFGSYKNLIALKDFRFREFYREQKSKH